MRDAVRYYKSMAERVQMQEGGTSGRSLRVGEEHEIRRLEIQLAICDNEKMKCMEELRQWKIMAERRGLLCCFLWAIIIVVIIALCVVIMM
ncbi:hypothetical protein Ancab_040139 [Ancistrocladus abbreviatus]